MKKNIGYKKELKKSSKVTLFLVIALFLAFTFFFVRSVQHKTAVISLEFSILPNDSKTGLAFAAYTEGMSYQDILALHEKSESAGIPLTFFVPVQPCKDQDILSSDCIFGIPPLPEGITVGDAGVIGVRYQDLHYDTQERLIRKTKQAFREKGITVTGFMPQTFSYDTVLAAENLKYDHIVLPAENETALLHPQAPHGGKMNILLFPFTGEIREGFNLVFLHASTDLSPLLLKPDISVMALDAWSARKRSIGSIRATMVTDTKDLSSHIMISHLLSDTALIVTSDMDIISASDGNSSIPFEKRGEGYLFVLNESMNQIIITWNPDNYK